MERNWGIPTFRSVEEMLRRTSPSFVVLSVRSEALPSIILELIRNEVPVMTETPPASDLDALIVLNQAVGDHAKLQVAEQYMFQPLHAARLSVIQAGLLGEVSHAQVSVAHDYHGISIMRHMLGVAFEDAEIQAMSYTAPLIQGPGRKGGPAEEQTIASNQVIAQLQFGDKSGVYDFSGDQYFSWIRSPRLLVRGDRGEIHNATVKYLQDFATPMEFDLKRMNAGEDGNLEGYYLKGILAGERWAYHNPFIPARLSDDEIAIATCLDKMGSYVNGGPSFYSLAEASQDHYLGLMIKQAVVTGNKVRSTRQCWAQ